MLDFIRTMREASYIKRYHTRRIIGEQTNGQHSFNVAMLAIAVTDKTASSNLIKACLYHDMPELSTSDVSAPLKLESPIIAEELSRLEAVFLSKYGMSIKLTEQEEHILKFCDTAELCYYCAEQVLMGNSSLEEVFDRGYGYLIDHINDPLVESSCSEFLGNMIDVKWNINNMIKGTQQ